MFTRRRTDARYERHRPETTALYEVVRDLETLYGAIEDGDARHPAAEAREDLGRRLRNGPRGRDRQTSALSSPTGESRAARWD